MNQEELRKIIETAVRAGIRLGIASAGETRSLGGRSSFTETHIGADQINAIVESSTKQLSQKEDE